MKQQLTVDTIKEKVIPILKEAGVKRSSLFGSYVRGEATNDSDVDILVDFPNKFTLFDVVDLKYKLEDSLGKKVDVVDYSAIKPQLKPYIMKDQLPIL